MKTLSAFTQGIKGGKSKQEKHGYASLQFDGNKVLSIDNFTGIGERYKQRENPIVCIFDGFNCIFEGTHEQLINRLK